MNSISLLLFVTLIVCVNSMLFTCGPCFCTSNFKKGICGGRQLNEIPDLGGVARSQMKHIDLRKNLLKHINITQMMRYKFSRIIIDIRQQISGCVSINGIVPENIIILSDDICIHPSSSPRIEGTTQIKTESEINDTRFSTTLPENGNKAEITTESESPYSEFPTTLPYIIPFITTKICNEMCKSIAQGRSLLPVSTTATTTISVSTTTTPTATAENTVEKEENLEKEGAETTTFLMTNSEITDMSTMSIVDSESDEEDLRKTQKDGEKLNVIMSGGTQQMEVDSTVGTSVSYEISNSHYLYIGNNTKESEITEIPVAVNVNPTLTIGIDDTKQVSLFLIFLVFIPILLTIICFSILIWRLRQIRERRSQRINNSHNIQLSNRSDFMDFVENESGSENENVNIQANPYYSLVTFSPPPPALPP